MVKPEPELNPERGIIECRLNAKVSDQYEIIRLKVIGYVNKWMKLNEGLRIESQNKPMKEN